MQTATKTSTGGRKGESVFRVATRYYLKCPVYNNNKNVRCTKKQENVTIQKKESENRNCL